MNYYEIIRGVLEDWWLKLVQLAPNMVVALLVFLFFFYSAKFWSNLITKIILRIFPNNKNAQSSLILAKVVKYVVLVMGVYICMQILHLNNFVLKFVGSLGVAGIVAGVALKDLVASLFSGILVGVDQSFKVGDNITIGNHSGTVQEIGFLTTKLLTDEGKKVYVPNQVIFNAPFYNTTASPQRKVILSFGIPATQNIQLAQTAIATAIEKVEKAQEAKPDVIFTDITAGSITVQVKFWVEIGANVSLVKSNAILALKTELDKNGIQFIIPTNINIVSEEKGDVKDDQESKD